MDIVTATAKGAGMAKLLFEKESYAIRGAVFEVHGEMGCGFLEAVHQECMERELTKRGIPFEARKDLLLTYKGQPLKQVYKADLICYHTPKPQSKDWSYKKPLPSPFLHPCYPCYPG